MVEKKSKVEISNQHRASFFNDTCKQALLRRKLGDTGQRMVQGNLLEAQFFDETENSWKTEQ